MVLLKYQAMVNCSGKCWTMISVVGKCMQVRAREDIGKCSEEVLTSW